jgi:hypothetical protein
MGLGGNGLFLLLELCVVESGCVIGIGVSGMISCARGVVSREVASAEANFPGSSLNRIFLEQFSTASDSSIGSAAGVSSVVGGLPHIPRSVAACGTHFLSGAFRFREGFGAADDESVVSDWVLGCGVGWREDIVSRVVVVMVGTWS